MATISNTPRPGYVWDSTDNVWYPIGVGAHQHTNAADTPAVIPNALVDAKGDLLTATADNTPARLAVGSNGDTIVADSSTSTGLRYTAGTVQANPVLNSAMQIAQRGTSFSLAAGTNSYTLDRWQKYSNGNATTISRQATGDTTNLPNIQYALRFQRNAGQTSTNLNAIGQSFETINSIPFAGKTVTISFYARKGANYSATADALSVFLSSGTGTDQNLLVGGFTGASYPVNSSATLTATWQRFTFTGSIASTATEIGFYFGYNGTGTAGADDYFEVTGAQIDIGSVALPFRTYAGTIQGETSACQRYYQIIAQGINQYVINANNWYAFDVRGVYTFPVQMRTAPTLVATTGTNYYRVQYNTTTDDLDSLSIAASSVRNCLLYNDTQASVTAGTPALIITNNASASVAISAEL